MLFRRLANRLKVIKNYYDIKLLMWKRDNAQSTQEGKVVYFNLSQKNAERYLYGLIYFFYKAGYQIFLKDNFSFIASCTSDGKKIFSIPTLSLVANYNPNEEVVFITDRKKYVLKNNNWKKTFLIDFDIYSMGERQNSIQLPFPMSPSNYEIDVHCPWLNLRDTHRNIGVFFSGNTSKVSYTNSIIKDFFHKVNRYEIIKFLKERMPIDKLLIVNHIGNSLDEQELLNKFVLVDWEWSPNFSKNLTSRVNNEDWLLSLSKCNFFLACPGVTMPMCHNIIEAMSVGTIPITEYPEYFNPPLKHLENCIVYSGKEDLYLKINEAFQMDKLLIQNIRTNVIKFFDHYLSSESFITNVENTETKENILFMNAENVSYQVHTKNMNRN